jgi:co-chaperonin GroES (HSP10)
MDLQPLGDRFIVEILDEEARSTRAASCCPTPPKEKPQRGNGPGAVGPGSRDEDGEYIRMDVEVGDEGSSFQVRRDRDQGRRRRRAHLCASRTFSRRSYPAGSKGKKKQLAGAAA